MEKYVVGRMESKIYVDLTDLYVDLDIGLNSEFNIQVEV